MRVDSLRSLASFSLRRVMPAVAVGESRPLLGGEMTGFNAALEVVVLTLLAASFCAMAPALQMNGT